MIFQSTFHTFSWPGREWGSIVLLASPLVSVLSSPSSNPGSDIRWRFRSLPKNWELIQLARRLESCASQIYNSKPSDQYYRDMVKWELTLTMKIPRTAAKTIHEVPSCTPLHGTKQLCLYPNCSSQASSRLPLPLNGQARSWILRSPQHWNWSWIARIACASLLWKYVCHCCSRWQDRMLPGKM